MLLLHKDFNISAFEDGSFSGKSLTLDGLLVPSALNLKSNVWLRVSILHLLFVDDAVLDKALPQYVMNCKLLWLIYNI